MKLITRIHIIGAYIISKRSRFLQRAQKGRYKDMEDEKFLKLKGKYSMRPGTELDLTHPKTLCEKLNWLKINERRHLYTLMVDKYEAKRWPESVWVLITLFRFLVYGTILTRLILTVCRISSY